MIALRSKQWYIFSMIVNSEKASIRLLKTSSEDHHIYKNANLYWLHFTVHYGKSFRMSKRVRKSLGTSDITLARSRRDALLNQWSAQVDEQSAA